MKIGVISTMLGQPWTGSEELWADTVEAALGQGDEVLISLWKWPETPPRVQALQDKGARVLFRNRPGRIPTWGGVLKRLAGDKVGPRRSRALSPYREVFEFQPDVILLSQGWTWEFKDHPDLVAQLRRTKVPLVIVNQASPDGWVSDDFRVMLRRLAPRAAKIAFVAQGNLRSTERQIAAPLPNGIVVRNPVNLQDRSIVPWPQEETWNMANVGRLETGHKGQDVLLEALSDPVWRERSWKLRFFGSGWEREYIAALIKHFGVGDHASFGGHVPNVRSIWEDHHLLVMPSRVEGTPLALVEAMLCGRPAVVTDVAGNAEWVEEGATGFVAEAPSGPSVFNALERAWARREEWRAMGEAAHETAAHRYDPHAGQTMLSILREAAATRQSKVLR